MKKLMAGLLALWAMASFSETQTDLNQALFQAAREGNEEDVKALLSAGADINAEDNNGETPLHYAAWTENPAVIEALAAAGADINAEDNNGETPLYLAVYNRPTMVEALAAAEADANAEDDNGRTLLYAGKYVLIELLVNRLISGTACVKMPKRAKTVFALFCASGPPSMITEGTPETATKLNLIFKF